MQYGSVYICVKNVYNLAILAYALMHTDYS